MPILNIKALPQKNPGIIQHALKQTCVAISVAYGCKPEQVWATWESIDPGMYVEGLNPANEQCKLTHPPIAVLTCFEGKSDEQIEKILLVASSTLGEHLGLGDNIFMTYNEAKSGKVITGNGIVRKNS